MFVIPNIVHSDRIARRRDDARAEIVAAAWTLARRDGLTAITVRDLAQLVGLKAPSLYSYFASKHAIYDAMFREGALAFEATIDTLPPTADARTQAVAGLRAFVEFGTADPVRFQLLFQRTIPGFEPTPDTYSIALRAFDAGARRFAELGITDRRIFDLWTALATGLASQQIANDPGGDRWTSLVDTAADMFLAYVRPASPRRKGQR